MLECGAGGAPVLWFAAFGQPAIVLMPVGDKALLDHVRELLDLLAIAVDLIIAPRPPRFAKCSKFPVSWIRTHTIIYS